VSDDREGFRRLGEVKPTELDLPESRARALLLQDTWARLAGPAVVQRTGIVAVRRGVLEVRCLDRRWKGALTALLPRLARALATECPQLALASWRLAVDGVHGGVETAPILALVDAKPVLPAADPRPVPAEPSAGASLLEVRDRYLEVRRPPRP